MGSDFRTIELSDSLFEHEGLRLMTVKSAALKGRVDTTLFVPEGLPAARVPLVILLHGVYGSHWAWALKGGAHRTAARMIRDESVPPMVIAMPSDGLWGDGSGYLRHPEQDFERWIVEELPAAVAHSVPGVTTDSPKFIAGLSMGGFGALRIGAKHAPLFRGVSGHSSITRFEQLARFVEENLATYRVPEEDRTVIDTILAHRAELPPLRFDCGTDDSLLDDNRELHRQLLEHGIVHQYAEFSGGHEWPYWSRHIAETLRFFAAQL